MTEALARLREAMTGKTRLTPFVGAGFSSAATSGAAHASWRGLLLDGIKVCERVNAPMPSGWAGRMKDQLDNADAFTYIAAADDITRRLRAVREGQEFGSWPRRTVGGLHPTQEGQQIIEAVCRLGSVVVTTNYDSLIEKVKPRWHSYTWTDDEYKSANITPRTVLHLHGVAEDPDSVILSSADYQRFSADELTQVLNKSLFASRRFIFIGCGDGLIDPDITTLMEFVKRAIPAGKTEHYILVTGGQLRQLNKHPISPRITPVAYGSGFRELTPFLQKLAAGEEIDASQDPDYYDRQAAARPRTALLDLAGPGWEKLQAARDGFRRAVRAMDQVEHRGAVPAGMTGWDYRDQLAVHEQLAASVRDPAARLESCLAEAVSALEEAAHDIGQLTTSRFARFATELEPMITTVSELENLTWRLLSRVSQTRDDLRARTEACGDYRPPFGILSRAHESIDNASDIAISLTAGLARLRPDPSAGNPPAAQPTAQAPEPPVARSGPGTTGQRDLRLVPDTARADPAGTAEPDLTGVSDAASAEPAGPAEPDFRRVPLLWEVSAGELVLADEGNVRDYLALPAQHVRGDDVFMLEVKGDSMTGEDGVLEGDYVIVDPRASWNDGDMVVVFVGSDDRATVKRIWDEGSSLRLQPSNPAYPPQIVTAEDRPVIQGKVIGVARWHVREGRRRPEPPG
jgi:SOS-response transcriptional repressor LexA